MIEMLLALLGGMVIGPFRTDKYAGRIWLGLVAFMMLARIDAGVATLNSTSPLIYIFAPLWVCLAAILGIKGGREIRIIWLNRSKRKK